MALNHLMCMNHTECIRCAFLQIAATDRSLQNTTTGMSSPSKSGDRVFARNGPQCQYNPRRETRSNAIHHPDNPNRPRSESFFMSVPPNSPATGPILTPRELKEQLDKLDLDERRKEHHMDRIVRGWGSDTCLASSSQSFIKRNICASCKQELSGGSHGPLRSPEQQMNMPTKDQPHIKDSPKVTEADLDFWSDDDGLLDDVDEACELAKREALREETATSEAKAASGQYRTLSNEILAGRIERQQYHVDKLRIQGNAPELTLDYSTVRAFVARGSRSGLEHDRLSLGGLSFLHRSPVPRNVTGRTTEGLLEAQERHIGDSKLRPVPEAGPQYSGGRYNEELVEAQERRIGDVRLKRRDSFDEAVASIADRSRAGSVMQADIANEYDEEEEVLRVREGRL